ncbi:hypothetical protein QAZ01_05520 [Glaesserella parasuis]|nr:hypothetical protein [Glaesserella parasuis]MDG6450408.1 hypothetical protein [Glaesserella parasuis]MDO9791408.1 hypothetical protein [Glaesserella parasuis]MDO9798833.1 hypothetical protein [Glaesserella parasuis]MDO9833667.1 hypothetical protein [Glaesserella parasuis]MDO9850804.1 hypothetical protein [Glaesserella parasuis]
MPPTIPSHMCYSEFNDIHSPRVPKSEEIEHLLRKALKVVPKERLWIPNCCLKTRVWKETIEQLQVMVEVTKKLRAELV